jgi:hypothetical protein
MPVHPFHFRTEYTDEQYEDQVKQAAQQYIGDDDLKVKVEVLAKALFDAVHMEACRAYMLAETLEHNGTHIGKPDKVSGSRRSRRPTRRPRRTPQTPLSGAAQAPRLGSLGPRRSQTRRSRRVARRGVSGASGDPRVYNNQRD